MEDGPELYDLDTDPAETTDLSDNPEHDDVLQDLLCKFASWSLQARDTLPEVYPVNDLAAPDGPPE